MGAFKLLWFALAIDGVSKPNVSNHCGEQSYAVNMHICSIAFLVYNGSCKAFTMVVVTDVVLWSFNCTLEEKLQFLSLDRCGEVALNTLKGLYR